MRESDDSLRPVGVKVLLAEKAQEAHAAFERVWVGNPLSFEKAQTRLEIREKPQLRMKGDLIVGVSYYDVHLYDAQGREIPIDPTRHIVNHPQYPRSSITYDVDGRRILGQMNPQEAGWEAVGDSILAMPNPKRFGTRGTVTTVYATAPGGNGYVRSTSTTYATARSGNSLAVLDGHRVGQTVSGSDYFIYESFVIFDTSGLPDTDTVSDVVLSLDGSADQSVTDFTVNAAASSYDGGAVVTGDWVDGSATLPGLTVLATFNSSGYDAAYNAFTSAGASFNSAINLTGNTALILYSDRHAAGTTPTGNEYITFTDADAAGTTTDAKLDITHAAAGGGAKGSLFRNSLASGRQLVGGRLAM